MKTEGRITDEITIIRELECIISKSYDLVGDILTLVNTITDGLIMKLESGSVTLKEIETEKARMGFLKMEAEHLNNFAKQALERLMDYQWNNAEARL